MATELQQTSSPAARRIGVILVLIIAAIALSLLVPSIQSMREQDRRTTCLNHAHTIGLAMQDYAGAYNNALPPSAETYKKPAGKYAVGGYSFLVKAWPFSQTWKLWNSLPRTIPDGDVDAAMSGDPILAEAMNRSFPDFVCPSNTNSKFKNPAASPPQFAFTNYKAMGATTRDSLLMVSNPSGTPPYGTAEMHPDGALFPSSSNLAMASLTDDTSHTIMTMETVDDQNSRWMVGNECTLVGLPQVLGAVEKNDKYPFYAPPGFDNTFGEDSGVTRAGLRTFLMYDFRPGGADAGKYEDPGWAKAPPAYGPSSMHPAVVIVGMCDGTVMAMNKRCDAANMFFLITKSNSDPAW